MEGSIDDLKKEVDVIRFLVEKNAKLDEIEEKLISLIAYHVPRASEAEDESKPRLWLKEFAHMNFELYKSFCSEQYRLHRERNTLRSSFEEKVSKLLETLQKFADSNDEKATDETLRKYVKEKAEAASKEKQKADEIVQKIRRKCDEENPGNPGHKKTMRYLSWFAKKHDAMIDRILDEVELNLVVHHPREIQRIQHQVENEMKERASVVSLKHEMETDSLQLQHEDVCMGIQADLDTRSLEVTCNESEDEPSSGNAILKRRKTIDEFLPQEEVICKNFVALCHERLMAKP